MRHAMLHATPQARLVELTGVAADIADARAQTQTAGDIPFPPRQPGNAMLDAAGGGDGGSAPLDLFGCVGEGAPADSMAQEALLLWVGMCRAPTECWGSVSGVLIEEDEFLRGVSDRYRKMSLLDKPVLKGMFCASEAIRVRLAQSLLEVCGASCVARGEIDSPAEKGTFSAVGKNAPGTEQKYTKVTMNQGLSNGVKGTSEEGEKRGGMLLLPDTTAETTAAAMPGSVGRRKPLASTAALRERVVQLLLANIPWAEKYYLEGEGEVAVVKSRQEQPRNCTQLFDVLCALVGDSIKVKCSHARVGALHGKAQSLCGTTVKYGSTLILSEAKAVVSIMTESVTTCNTG